MLRITRLQGCLSLALGAVALTVILNPSPRESAAVSSEVAKRQPPVEGANANVLALAGSASCSGRGCHGALDPNDPKLDKNKVGQNEYVHWTRDPHADAYRVLFDPRSIKIAKNLGNTPAHKREDCLACHATPQAVKLPESNPLAHEEKQFGVGCESCHGSAEKWMVPHTRTDWRKLTSQEKSDHGMVPVTGDLAKRAEMCAGCHIGAPADPKYGTPVRDMNHDLIAAGHPRLHFEFSAFQANMPTHWRTKKYDESYLWAVGQFATAKVALELLENRAGPDDKDRPWPEYAEYDCFACHHSLSAPSWRQPQERRGRKPGALPWGSWSFALTRQLESEMQTDSKLKDALDALETTMQSPYPNRKLVKAKVAIALDQVKSVGGTFAEKWTEEPKCREFIRGVVHKHHLADRASWDGVEQLYLALHALNASEAKEDVTLILKELTPIRAFRTGYDSPLSIALPTGTAKAFRPEDFLEKLSQKRQ